MNLSCVLASSALLLLAPFATAQLHSGMPSPLGGIPMTPPPVDHPALGAQPLFGDPGCAAPSSPTSPAKPAEPAEPAKCGPACKKEADPDTYGPKRIGADLKKAVATVKALEWQRSLADAKALSAATGKPILWLQALGDIGGFA